MEHNLFEVTGEKLQRIQILGYPTLKGINNLKTDREKCQVT